MSDRTDKSEEASIPKGRNTMRYDVVRFIVYGLAALALGPYYLQPPVSHGTGVTGLIVSSGQYVFGVFPYLMSHPARGILALPALLTLASAMARRPIDR